MRCKNAGWNSRGTALRAAGVEVAAAVCWSVAEEDEEEALAELVAAAAAADAPRLCGPTCACVRSASDSSELALRFCECDMAQLRCRDWETAQEVRRTAARHSSKQHASEHWPLQTKMRQSARISPQAVSRDACAQLVCPRERNAASSVIHCCSRSLLCAAWRRRVGLSQTEHHRPMQDGITRQRSHAHATEGVRSVQRRMARSAQFELRWRGTAVAVRAQAGS